MVRYQALIAKAREEVEATAEWKQAKAELDAIAPGSEGAASRLQIRQRMTAMQDKRVQADRAIAAVRKEIERQKADDAQEFAKFHAAMNLSVSVNGRILAFCRQAMGKQVGDGQCTALAATAAGSAGAKEWFKLTPRGSDDYVWGQLICVLDGNSRDTSKIRAGDIIQMRGVVQVHGATAEHHTAIVKEIGDGNIVVYEQNSNGRMFVVESLYRVADLTAGRMMVYRPF
jgi:hypothetical protein